MEVQKECVSPVGGGFRGGNGKDSVWGRSDSGGGGDGDAAAASAAATVMGPQRSNNFVSPVGYAAVGDKGGIGMFIWDTQSIINRGTFPRGSSSSEWGGNRSMDDGFEGVCGTNVLGKGPVRT